MSGTFTLLALILCINTSANSVKTISPALLRDGFVLAGVEGKLITNDSNDTWFFELVSDITDDKIIVKAGTSLKLLPSTTLENMITDANERSENHYLLWGRITQYKGTNYIFPDYFSPLKAPSGLETTPEKNQAQNEPEKTSPSEETKQKPSINDPNDPLTIPKEVIEKLKAARDNTPAGAQRSTDVNSIRDTLQRKTQNEQQLPSAEDAPSTSTKRYSQNIDSIFVDRTAFLSRNKMDELIFVLDAFGQNVSQKSFRLLPCKVLELTEQKQTAEPEPVRFKIAGIVTKYKGNDYLLLQKATRVYSNGNFGR